MYKLSKPKLSAKNPRRKRTDPLDLELKGPGKLEVKQEKNLQGSQGFNENAAVFEPEIQNDQ
jgi:hypothetical protein